MDADAGEGTTDKEGINDSAYYPSTGQVPASYDHGYIYLRAITIQAERAVPNTLSRFPSSIRSGIQVTHGLNEKLGTLADNFAVHPSTKPGLLLLQRGQISIPVDFHGCVPCKPSGNGDERGKRTHSWGKANNCHDRLACRCRSRRAAESS